MTKEEIIETLNKIPETRYPMPEVDKLYKIARQQNMKLGDYLANLFQNNHSTPTAASPTISNKLLGPELKAMFDSGCTFSDSKNPKELVLFVSEQGMLWDKTWTTLSEGQRRKLNVTRKHYWEWCERTNTPAWTEET